MLVALGLLAAASIVLGIVLGIAHRNKQTSTTGVGAIGRAAWSDGISSAVSSVPPPPIDQPAITAALTSMEE